jgi:hypothetical protein
MIEATPPGRTPPKPNRWKREGFNYENKPGTHQPPPQDGLIHEARGAGGGRAGASFIYPAAVAGAPPLVFCKFARSTAC